ncbi:MAG: helix-turn-helix domain-containing protein [Hyphomicrobiaceae bacterium]
MSGVTLVDTAGLKMIAAIRNAEIRPLRRLTSDEAARELGLRPQTLRTWRWRRQGPPWLKVGGKVFYDEREVHAWLERCRVEPTPESV